MKEYNRDTKYTFSSQELIDLAFEWCHNPEINTDNEDPEMMVVGFLINIENEMGEIYNAESLIEKLKEDPLILNTHTLVRAYKGSPWHFLLKEGFDINKSWIQDGILEGFEAFFQTDIERNELKRQLLIAVGNEGVENMPRRRM